MREYSFVNENGWYALVQTKHRNVEVWGIGSKDRKVALKRAKEYCKNSFAKLRIEA